MDLEKLYAQVKFITTTFFLMYRAGQENRMLQGNFVIKMQDEKTIDAVYRWK